MARENRLIVRRTTRRGPKLTRGPVPQPKRGHALFRTLLTGIDGTDEEVARRPDVEAPARAKALVLGHEALARVVRPARKRGRLRAGAHVVPLVRQGCGTCVECKSGALDMCPSSDYQEHGIRRLDGFMQDYWTDEEAHVVAVPASLGPWAVLVEPMSIVVKALDQASRVQSRLPWFHGFADAKALVVGSGSLASMAVLLLREQGLRVSVMDRHGAKAASTRLWRRVDATHIHARSRSTERQLTRDGGFALVMETTGVPSVVVQAAQAVAPNGILVLLGIPGRGDDPAPLPIHVLRELVLHNQAVVGSVNSNRGHFEQAIRTLAKIRRRDAALFDLVVTHRFTPEQAKRAFDASDDSVVKKIINWTADGP